MADCSKTVDFVKELNRMHDHYESLGGCCGCPYYTWWTLEHKRYSVCDVFIHEEPEKAVELLQIFSETHPEPKPKTYADVFFEKFPNAPKDRDCIPFLCRKNVFATRYSGCDDSYNCSECWSEPYPEGGDSSGS